MKKHSKKEEANLDELDYMIPQDSGLKSDYESIFKSDKKDELLKDLMKVDFSNLNRHKGNSSDLDPLEIHNNSEKDGLLDLTHQRKNRSNNKNSNENF